MGGGKVEPCATVELQSFDTLVYLRRHPEEPSITKNLKDATTRKKIGKRLCKFSSFLLGDTIKLRETPKA
jgi:hypothetical protein